ncbi:hypothetical protein ACFRCW_32930 [Streptomyces sp. NPDC056653]|uniref:hypothetical protein n=1 Tax=Streptomyces sp. NPDC056653 TaxID=3345894 RepID=UPI00369A74F8
MARPLPDPHTLIGRRRDGRPIFPILGADPTDPLGDPEQPPSASPTASGTVVDQELLSKLLAREKEQDGRSAVRKLVEQLGFGKSEDLAAFVKAQQDAQDAQLTKVQRRRRPPTTPPLPLPPVTPRTLHYRLLLWGGHHEEPED